MATAAAAAAALRKTGIVAALAHLISPPSSPADRRWYAGSSGSLTLPSMKRTTFLTTYTPVGGI